MSWLSDALACSQVFVYKPCRSMWMSRDHECKHTSVVMYAGVVNGVQSSLQNLFQSLSYVAGLVFWSPQDFPLLMYASTGVVYVAAVVYSVFVCCCRVSGTDL